MPPKTGREDTRLIRAGQNTRPAVKTVGPSIQKGSTVLLPDAASLYDDAHADLRTRAVGRSPQEALAELEHAGPYPLSPGLKADRRLLAVLKTSDDGHRHHARRATFLRPILKRWGQGRYFDPLLRGGWWASLGGPGDRWSLARSFGADRRRVGLRARDPP